MNRRSFIKTSLAFLGALSLGRVALPEEGDALFADGRYWFRSDGNLGYINDRFRLITRDIKPYESIDNVHVRGIGNGLFEVRWTGGGRKRRFIQL